MDNQVSRRRFLTGLLAIPAAGAVTAPVVAIGQYVYPPDSLLQPPAPKKVAKVADLKLWEGHTFDYNDLPAVLVKTGENEYVSYYLKCTHLGCSVEVPKGSLEGKQLICPCHGGVFDAQGNNVSGPPPKPLPRLAVTVENGEIIVQERSA